MTSLTLRSLRGYPEIRVASARDWLGATWSLAVEEQFYLLLPFAVRRLSRRGLTWLTVLFIVCAPVIRWTLSRSGNTFFGPYVLLPCRMDTLGFGVLIGLACRQEAIWNWLKANREVLYAAFAFLSCGVAYLLHSREHLYTAGLTCTGLFYAVLLLLVLSNPGPIEKAVFRNPLLVYLGTVSYCVYIIHNGVNGLLHFTIFGRGPSVNGLLFSIVTLISLSAVMAISTISWRFFEGPLVSYARGHFKYGKATDRTLAAAPVLA